MKHSKYSMICWFIRQAMAGGAITVFGDGSQVRDYIFVDDLAEAMITSGMHSFPTDGPLGHVFNVGCGAGARFIDMANTVVAAVGSGSVEPMDWPADYENVETGDYVTDITAVREALDWSPRVTLDDGIERTVRYYRDHGHKYFSR
jgi:nucleoside-diphosphate-sugar epimerase